MAGAAIGEATNKIACNLTKIAETEARNIPCKTGRGRAEKGHFANDTAAIRSVSKEPSAYFCDVRKEQVLSRVASTRKHLERIEDANLTWRNTGPMRGYSARRYFRPVTRAGGAVAVPPEPGVASPSPRIAGEIFAAAGSGARPDTEKPAISPRVSKRLIRISIRVNSFPSSGETNV